eukprot:evm.model.scf_462.6 EVM.evm.TU.scf_462.6   scf_462:33473-45017(-)
MPAAGGAPRDSEWRSERGAADTKGGEDESEEADTLLGHPGSTQTALDAVSPLSTTHRDPSFHPGNSAGGFLSSCRFKDRCVRATEKEVTRLTVSPDFQDWLRWKMYKAGRGARWGVAGFAVMFFIATIAALERNAKLQLVEEKMLLAGGERQPPTAAGQVMVAAYCKEHVADLENLQAKMKKEISELTTKAEGMGVDEKDAHLQKERKEWEQEKSRWKKEMGAKGSAARAAQDQTEADKKRIQNMQENLDKDRIAWDKQQALKDEEMLKAMKQIQTDREQLFAAQKKFASEKDTWKRTPEARSAALQAAGEQLARHSLTFTQQSLEKTDVNGMDMQAVQQLREELSILREEAIKYKTRESELWADEKRLVDEQRLAVKEGAQECQAIERQDGAARSAENPYNKVPGLWLLCCMVFALVAQVFFSRQRKDKELKFAEARIAELQKELRTRVLHLPEHFADPPRSEDEVDFANEDAMRQNRDRNNRLKVRVEAMEELMQETSELEEFTRDLDHVRRRNREPKMIAAKEDKLKESAMLVPAKQRQAELEALALEEKAFDLGKAERRCLDLKARCKELQELAESVPELEAQVAKLEEIAAERSEVLYEVEQRALKVTQLEAEIREKEQVADRLPAVEREMKLVLQQAAQVQTLEEEADELEIIASTWGAVKARNIELKQKVAEVAVLEEECRDLVNAAMVLDTLREKSELLREQVEEARALEQSNRERAQALREAENEVERLEKEAQDHPKALMECDGLQMAVSDINTLEQESENLKKLGKGLDAKREEHVKLKAEVERKQAAHSGFEKAKKGLEDEIAKLGAESGDLSGLRKIHSDLKTSAEEVLVLKEASKKLVNVPDDWEHAWKEHKTLKEQGKEAGELRGQNAKLADQLEAVDKGSASLRGVADRLEAAMQEHGSLNAKANEVRELEEECDRLRQVAESLSEAQEKKAALAKQVEAAEAAAEESRLLAAELKSEEEDAARLNTLVDQLPSARQKHRELQDKAKELHALVVESNKLEATARSLESAQGRGQVRDVKASAFAWDRVGQAHARPSQDPETFSDAGDSIAESAESYERKRVQVKYKSESPVDNLAQPKQGWQHKEGPASATIECAGSQVPQQPQGEAQNGGFRLASARGSPTIGAYRRQSSNDFSFLDPFVLYLASGLNGDSEGAAAATADGC